MLKEEQKQKTIYQEIEEYLSMSPSEKSLYENVKNRKFTSADLDEYSLHKMQNIIREDIEKSEKKEKYEFIKFEVINWIYFVLSLPILWVLLIIKEIKEKNN